MDIQKLKELHDEFNYLVSNNWKLIKEAYPTDTMPNFYYFDICEDDVELISKNEYGESEYAYIPISFFESEEILRASLERKIFETKEKFRLMREEENRRNSEKAAIRASDEYKKFLELKEKFENI